MQINNVSLAAVCVKPEQYPTDVLPEFAFVGRSNVGKSSLINTLLKRKSLARTSQTPGKTRTINFYNVEEKLFFVDLPGYGYAKLTRSESEKWGRMSESYLKNRPQLKRIILLVDIRHEPQRSDAQMYEWLSWYKYKMLIVATKSDKIKKNQIQKQLSVLRNGLGVATDIPLVPFSSKTREGFDAVWEIISSDLYIAD